ncbi:MAG: Bug family tripartite tricarboxylate transporter substrate binding protein [Pseudomonadota bacterium]
MVRLYRRIPSGRRGTRRERPSPAGGARSRRPAGRLLAGLASWALGVASVAMSGVVPAAEPVAKYPQRPVRVIIPLAPGGGSDIVGRIAASALTERWGETVIVDNRPGAGSAVGTLLAVRAAPDGHTLLVTSSSLAITPALRSDLGYDVRRDLVPVTQLAHQPSVLAVHPSLPATSVKELIAVARAQPGRYAYGSAGPGSATHMGSELFRLAAGIDLLHLPYKSAGLATSALLAGEVQVLLTNMASVLPQAKAGRVRMLAVTSAKRVAVAPDLPTLAESGLPRFEYQTWYGALLPAGTPARVVEVLHRDLVAAMGGSVVSDRMAQQGLSPVLDRPAQFARYLGEELDRWAAVARKAGIRAD